MPKNPVLKSRWRVTNCRFHDQHRRLRLSKRERNQIFLLPCRRFWRTIKHMPNANHHQVQAVWSLTVESWLVCQGLITVRPNKNQKVSTHFYQNWAHN
jgi:hypothetical protein